MLSAEPLVWAPLCHCSPARHGWLQQRVQCSSLYKGSRGSSDWKAMTLFEGSLPLVGDAEGSRGCEQGFPFPDNFAGQLSWPPQDHCDTACRLVYRQISLSF